MESTLFPSLSVTSLTSNRTLDQSSNFPTESPINHHHFHSFRPSLEPTRVPTFQTIAEVTETKGLVTPLTYILLGVALFFFLLFFLIFVLKQLLKKHSPIVDSPHAHANIVYKDVEVPVVDCVYVKSGAVEDSVTTLSPNEAFRIARVA